jgi:hypothetical protein
MYTGHVGIALAAMGVRHRVPLWALIFAAQGCDWVDAFWWIAGHDDPGSTRRLAFDGWTAQMASHSVPAVLVITIVCYLLYYATMRDGRGAALLGAVALSHVPVDYVTSVKPTWPGGPRIGLGLYAYPAVDFVIELLIVVAGWLLYRRSLRACCRSTAPAMWVMLGTLVVLQAIIDLGFAGPYSSP